MQVVLLRGCLGFATDVLISWPIPTFRLSVVCETSILAMVRFFLQWLLLTAALCRNETGLQTSQGKYIRFPFMQPLHLHNCILYSIGFLFLMQHHPYNHAYMQFQFVGSNVCRQLPSDSTSQWTPLLLAKTPYCKVSSGLPPYS